MTLIFAIQKYLTSILYELSHLLNEKETSLPFEINKNIEKKLLFKIAFYYLPFKAKRIIVPTDTGGRIIRFLLDLARIFNVDIFIAPVHNHEILKREKRRYFLRSYLNMNYNPPIGSYAQKAKIIINDDAMLKFFLEMGYERERLLILKGWINKAINRKAIKATKRYPFVFFTEALEEMSLNILNTKIIEKLLNIDIIERLYIKFHPRESLTVREYFKKYFEFNQKIRFLHNSLESFEIIKNTDIAIAAFSTVLLEALWLNKKIIILDNDFYKKTLLSYYIDKSNCIILNEKISLKDIYERLTQWIKPCF